MNLRRVSYDLYNEFYSKIYQDPDYEILRNESNNTVLINFYIELSKTIDLHLIDRNWIFRYLIYQFDYYVGKDTKFELAGSFKQVFAKKALSRFVNISKDFSWYNATKKITNLGIDCRVIEDAPKKSVDFFKIRVGEEVVKSRFHNTARGFVSCIEATTLYNHRSKCCIVCKYKSKCKVVLKANYPSIYLERGYEAR